MANVLLEISFSYQEEKTECQPCYVCEDVIYSNVYRLVFTLSGKIEETNICLCNSCYNAVSKQG